MQRCTGPYLLYTVLYSLQSDSNYYYTLRSGITCDLDTAKLNAMLKTRIWVTNNVLSRHTLKTKDMIYNQIEFFNGKLGVCACDIVGIGRGRPPQQLQGAAEIRC